MSSVEDLAIYALGAAHVAGQYRRDGLRLHKNRYWNSREGQRAGIRSCRRIARVHERDVIRLADKIISKLYQLNGEPQE